MKTSFGWVHEAAGRAHGALSRPALITMALLLVACELSAQPLALGGKDAARLLGVSARALQPVAEAMDVGLSGDAACKSARAIVAKPAAALRLYLDPARSGRGHRFSRERPQGEGSVEQEIVPGSGAAAQDGTAGGGTSDMANDVWNAIEFMSEPLPRAAVFSGAFSGRLDVVSNRKDFSFTVMVYELTRAGVYVPLSSYGARASALDDAARPHPLTPGVRQQLAFRGGRPLTHRVEQGSRLVLVLGVIKDAAAQPQGGPGRPEGGEAQAAPLTIHWFDDSYIELQLSGGTEDARGCKRADPDAPALPPRPAARAAGDKIA